MLCQNYIPEPAKHQINVSFFAYLPCKFTKIVYKMGSNPPKDFISMF